MTSTYTSNPAVDAPCQDLAGRTGRAPDLAELPSSSGRGNGQWNGVSRSPRYCSRSWPTSAPRRWRSRLRRRGLTGVGADARRTEQHGLAGLDSKTVRGKAPPRCGRTGGRGERRHGALTGHGLNPPLSHEVDVLLRRARHQPPTLGRRGRRRRSTVPGGPPACQQKRPAPY